MWIIKSTQLKRIVFVEAIGKLEPSVCIRGFKHIQFDEIQTVNIAIMVCESLTFNNS